MKKNPRLKALQILLCPRIKQSGRSARVACGYRVNVVGPAGGVGGEEEEKGW